MDSEKKELMFFIEDGILKKYTGNDEKTVYIPDGVSEIKDTAFLGHIEIESLHIPNSVKIIGPYAFVSCTELKHVSLGNGLKSIPLGCFTGLQELVDVSLFDSIETIDDFAFRGCRSLRHMVFLPSENNKKLTPMEKGLVLERILLGESVADVYGNDPEQRPTLRSIGNYAFADCPKLDYMHMKERAVNIGMNAFDESVKINDLSENDIVSYDEEEDIYLDREGAVQITESSEHENTINDNESGNTDSEIQPIKEDTPIGTYFDVLTSSNKKLIEGYLISEGKIIDSNSGKTYEDAPIHFLNLGNRALNCLNRLRFRYDGKKEIMVSDLLQLTMDDLMSIRHMGAKTAKEIITALKAFLNISGKNDSEEAPSSDNDFIIRDNIIPKPGTDFLVKDVSISVLGLGTSSTNYLMKGGINYLSDLLSVSEGQLLRIPSIGKKKISDIRAKISYYMETHRIDRSIDTETDQHIFTSSIDPSVIIPQMDDSIAAGYSLKDSTIYFKGSPVLQDEPITVLELKDTIINILISNGIKRVSFLVGMTYRDLLKMDAIGINKANDIRKALNQYLEANRTGDSHTLSDKQYISMNDVIDCFKSDEFKEYSFDEILSMLPDTKEENLIELLAVMVDKKAIRLNDDRYSLPHQSFSEYIQSITDTSVINERSLNIIRMRLAGKTLNEVGGSLGLTRERVRQLEKRAVDCITKKGTIQFREDRYKYIFTRYSLEKEFYTDYLDESRELWDYLCFRYSRGKDDPSVAIEDILIPLDIRHSIDKFIHRESVLIDGRYIQLNRADIEDYVVETYCKDEVTIDQFFDYYNRFLKNNDLLTDKLEFTEAVRYTRSNRLAESIKLLWKQNQRLRYYDIEGTDFTELLEVLNLNQYENIELSTRKFMIEYPELMDQYDIRDEYELHNLLKKIHAENENQTMRFGRMPSIVFGVFDRDAAVRDMLFAIAPVSMDNLAERLAIEYGVQPLTIKANWLNCISQYIHRGIYSVDFDEMPEGQVEVMRAELTDDFYPLSELKKKYKQLFPNGNEELVTPHNLKRIGLIVGDNYAINNYPSAESFFTDILTSEDIIDITSIKSRFNGIGQFYSVLSKLKYNLNIIEFEEDQYINIRRLENLGVSRERIKSYGDRVWSFLVDDEYFTIHSLRKSGFEDELDTLGFGDLFYSSILKADDRFTWQRIGNNIVLNPKGKQFSTHDFLISLISMEKTIDIYDFINKLSDYYGIDIDKPTIIEKIKNSDVYYDPIMENLYEDYETYFKEI